MKKCITHDYACDCREEVFKRLLEAAKRMIHLADAELLISPHAFAIKDLREAIPQAEEILK